MKRLIITVLVAILTLSLCACGNTGENSEETTVGKASADNTTTVSTSTADTSAVVSEWENFIAEYDAWVDQYIDIVNKYKVDPSDTTILAEYTELSNQVTEWSTRADALTEELKNSPEDAEKYATELLKIAEKLAEAMQ